MAAVSPLASETVLEAPIWGYFYLKTTPNTPGYHHTNPYYTGQQTPKNPPFLAGFRHAPDSAGLIFGGDERDRTVDLCVANASLSHLSYIPVESFPARGITIQELTVVEKGEISGAPGV